MIHAWVPWVWGTTKSALYKYTYLYLLPCKFASRTIQLSQTSPALSFVLYATFALCMHWVWSFVRSSRLIVSVFTSFYRTMLCISAVFAVMQCLSVTLVDHVKTNKHIFEIFSPSGSDAILVFPYQRGCRYSDGNPPNGGIECKGDMKNPAFRPLFSPISCSISQTVIVRWAHAARQFVNIKFSFYPCNI